MLLCTRGVSRLSCGFLLGLLNVVSVVAWLDDYLRGFGVLCCCTCLFGAFFIGGWFVVGFKCDGFGVLDYLCLRVYYVVGVDCCFGLGCFDLGGRWVLGVGLCERILYLLLFGCCFRVGVRVWLRRPGVSAWC